MKILLALAFSAALSAQQTTLTPDQLKQIAVAAADAGSVMLWAATSTGFTRIALGPTLKLTVTTGGVVVLDVAAPATPGTTTAKLVPIIGITRNADGSYNLPGGVPSTPIIVFRNGAEMLEGAGNDYVRAPYLLSPVRAWLLGDRITAWKVE